MRFLFNCWRLKQTYVFVITPVADKKKQHQTNTIIKHYALRVFNLKNLWTFWTQEIRIHSPYPSTGFVPGLHRDGGLIVKTAHAVGRTRLPCDAALLHIVEGLDGRWLYALRWTSLGPRWFCSLYPREKESRTNIYLKTIHFGGVKF